MADKQRVLIVDDDENIAELISLYLLKECYETKLVYDGESALREFREFKPNIVLLDLMLPGIDGYEVCRRIRQESKTPIIMLSAKGEVFDKVLGLELGADDYITKPFSAREVIARIKAVLRRFNMQETEPAQVLRYGNLEININNYDVRIDGERLPLTPKEVEIFQLLASHPGKVFSREKILSLVWGYDYYGDTRAVDTQIKRIRQKISQREEKGWTLKTVYGVGYRFEIVSEREDGTVSHENEAEDYGTDE